MRPACTCDPGRVCRPCELIATRADYVAVWDISADERESVRGRVGVRGESPVPPAKKTVKKAAKLNPKFDLSCVHAGETVRQGCSGTLFRCGLHGVLASKYPCKDAAMVCQTCPDRQSPLLQIGTSPPATNRVIIDHGAGGLGDWLLGACVAAKFKADNPDVHLTYNAGRVNVRNPQAFGALFDGIADEIGECHRVHSDLPVAGTLQMNIGYSAEDVNQAKRGTRTTLYDLTRWERYARNIGSTGYRIPELKEPERIRSSGRDVAGCIALCPFSTDSSREWSLHHWLTLESRLIAAGYRTAVFHSERSRTERFKGTKVIKADAERLAGCFLAAACVVGSDHGLSHLAGILKRPTIVLGGWFPVDRIYGLYPGFRGIQGGLDCSGCCNGGAAFNAKSPTCRPTCANLNSISVDRVLDAIDETVIPAIAEGSIVDYKRLRSIRDGVRATNHLAGDVAELGVYRGGSAKLIRHYAPGATLHLFDTFAGIPEDDTEEGGHRRGEFVGTLDEVRARVGTANTAFHVGAFPDVVPENARYRFAHIDGDTYQTTRAAIEYFAPRMVPGGVLVFDDWGWENCPGVAKALKELLPGRAERTAEYQAKVRF